MKGLSIAALILNILAAIGNSWCSIATENIVSSIAYMFSSIAFAMSAGMWIAKLIYERGER